MSLTLLFDLDGTLTDSAPGIVGCIAHALEVHGLPPVSEARMRACVGPPLHDSFRELAGGEDQVDSLVAAYRDRYVDVGMFENVVYGGVEALLDGLLDRGIALHVVTAKPEVYAEQVLDHFGLRTRFGAVFGPELEGSHMSKIELLEAACAALDLDRNGAVMIGDRGVDMSAARVHEIAAWGVRWGYGSDAELEAAGAQLLLDAPQDVLACVAQMAG